MHDTPASTSKTTGWLRRDLRPGRGGTVRISGECIVLMAYGNEMQDLRKQLYQAKQSIKGMREGMFSALNES